MIKGLSARVVLSLAVLGAVATGCTTPGNPTPGPTGSTSTEQTSKATSTKPSSGGDSLADFDSCEVLESLAAQLSLARIEAVDEKECGADYGDAGAVGLTKQPELAIGDAVGDGQTSDIPIGSRKAKLIEKPGSDKSCMVAIEVTPTSRVDVITSSRATLGEACESATKIATAIEPKLPK